MLKSNYKDYMNFASSALFLTLLPSKVKAVYQLIKFVNNTHFFLNCEFMFYVYPQNGDYILYLWQYLYRRFWTCFMHTFLKGKN